LNLAHQFINTHEKNIFIRKILKSSYLANHYQRTLCYWHVELNSSRLSEPAANAAGIGHDLPAGWLRGQPWNSKRR